ncbi:MAG: YdcF family protein [Anaerolineales bacterium]|nr:YdcF family protein [Anaerolineales bacterium]
MTDETPTRKSRKSFFKRLWLLLPVLLTGLLLWTIWIMTRKFEDRIYNQEQLGQIPGKKVAIVFGAGYWPSGRLSDVLRDRLDAAAELYQAGKVSKLLLSGDNRVVDYNEPAKMREYLLQQGIPDNDLVLDFAGRRTYDTCYRARDIFQVDQAILVTQRYHMPRAMETCNRLGVEATGYVSDRTTYVHIRWYRVREIPALWKALLDLTILHPVPVLGDQLPIPD